MKGAINPYSRNAGNFEYPHLPTYVQQPTEACYDEEKNTARLEYGSSIPATFFNAGPNDSALKE